MECPHCHASDGGIGYEKGTGLSNWIGQWHCVHCGWVEFDDTRHKESLERIQLKPPEYWKTRKGVKGA